MTNNHGKPDENYRFLTVSEVAELLRLGSSTVYQLISSGKLGAFRVGAARGGIRVSREDLERYLESARLERRYEAPRKESHHHLKDIRLCPMTRQDD